MYFSGSPQFPTNEPASFQAQSAIVDPRKTFHFIPRNFFVRTKSFPSLLNSNNLPRYNLLVDSQTETYIRPSVREAIQTSCYSALTTWICIVAGRLEESTPQVPMFKEISSEDPSPHACIYSASSRYTNQQPFFLTLHILYLPLCCRLLPITSIYPRGAILENQGSTGFDFASVVLIAWRCRILREVNSQLPSPLNTHSPPWEDHP